MKQFTRQLQVPTRGQGLYSITSLVAAWVAERKLKTGLLTMFIQHTSASLLIQENADPDVCRDLNEFFARLVREDAGWYRHSAEGADDMPAHIRTALTTTQLSIPILHGEMALGAWQGLYVFEHRSSAHRRLIVLHLLGE